MNIQSGFGPCRLTILSMADLTTFSIVLLSTLKWLIVVAFLACGLAPNSAAWAFDQNFAPWAGRCAQGGCPSAPNTVQPSGPSQEEIDRQQKQELYNQLYEQEVAARNNKEYEEALRLA